MADETQPEPTLEGDVLNCVGRDWTAIPADLGAKFGSKAKRLDLSYNALVNLSGLDQFKSLKELIVDNNDLKDGLSLPSLASLETLSLNKNSITAVDDLLETLIKACPKLTYLSLLGNLACPNELVAKDEEDYQRYRYYVLYKMPNLKFLDSRPTTPAEKAEAKRVGAYMKVVRPIVDTLPPPEPEALNFEGEAVEYKPLPDDLTAEGQGRATFGVCKYVYYGRHSEGNRFIRNNDL